MLIQTAAVPAAKAIPSRTDLGPSRRIVKLTHYPDDRDVSSQIDHFDAKNRPTGSERYLDLRLAVAVKSRARPCAENAGRKRRSVG